MEKQCEYPNCKAKATFKLSLADPDSEGSYYCEGHVDKRKREIIFELFGFRTQRCTAITGNGTQCPNSKKYGDLCGIHNKCRK